jgi:E3 ubiquitin-protein ligase NEDD4
VRLREYTDTIDRRATDESILAVQIFDQKKFKKKDQGFLGVVNVRIGSVLDLDVGGDGQYSDNPSAFTKY